MKKYVILFAALILGVVQNAGAAEFKLVRRFGEPVSDEDKRDASRVEFASWVDDEHIVFATGSGDVTALNVATGTKTWAIGGAREISDWSVSRGTKRLTYCYEVKQESPLDRDRYIVLDCSTGKPLLHGGRDQIKRILKRDFFVPCALALSPNDGRLIVCESSSCYGRNGYILDDAYRKVVGRFRVDPVRRKNVSLSADGRYLSLTAYRQVLSVRDLKADRDVFFAGERVLVDSTVYDPKTMTGTVRGFETVLDAPFWSGIRSDGRKVVYSQDSGGFVGNGKIVVRDLRRKDVAEFDGRNGHIEFDVDFKRERIVVTGTSTDLTLLRFDGKELIHAKRVTKDRNFSVEFSPSGRNVLVGSRDGTVSVFRIVQ